MLEERAIARLLIHEMAGNVPAVVVSSTVDPVKSIEVAAARLVSAACPPLGVVNPVTATVTAVAAAYVPAVSLTVNTELTKAAWHVGFVAVPPVVELEEDVTAQFPVVAASAIPAPDSVMMITAVALPVMACVGVNDTVAVDEPCL